MPDGGVARDAEEDAGFADARPDAAPDAAADAGPVDTGLPQYCTRFPMGYSEIPAGTFFMGARPEDRPPGRFFDVEEPRHGVEITRAYWLKQTEVTQGEWDEIGPALPNPSRRTGCPLCPVENVSWHQVVDWLNQLSRACGLTPCYPDTEAARVGVTLDLDCSGFRLPTEAEWEYAARAGTRTATYAGNLRGTVTDCTTPQANLDGIAWWCLNSGSRTQAVGGKAANAWGLRDMLGNVWEWTWDRYGTYPGTVTDPLGATTGSIRVARGGSWSSVAQDARSAVRYLYGPGGRGFLLGLRLARSLPSEPSAAVCGGRTPCFRSHKAPRSPQNRKKGWPRHCAPSMNYSKPTPP
jgi:formylglycine-generating enzyme required for sulfatase activity